MFVGVARIDLRVLESGSLKSKRHVVKGLIGGLRSKFNTAVAEVGFQEQWQRTALGVSCVSESAFHARKMLTEITRFVERDHRVELLSSTVDVYQPEDE